MFIFANSLGFLSTGYDLKTSPKGCLLYFYKLRLSDPFIFFYCLAVQCAIPVWMVVSLLPKSGILKTLH